jgi:hypothetical protein
MGGEIIKKLRNKIGPKMEAKKNGTEEKQCFFRKGPWRPNRLPTKVHLLYKTHI